MPFVMNALPYDQQIKVHGAWFTFKAKQIKEMSEDKVAYLTDERGSYRGFVSIPDACADLEFRSSKEGQAAIKEAEERGIAARVQFLEKLRHNELVSLQKDIDRSGAKYDARTEMSPEMIKNLEELASYAKRQADAENAKVEKIKEIEKLLGK